MKNIFFFSAILISFTCCAQRTKVQNFKLVSYDMISSKNLEINSYSTINQDGRLNIFVNGNNGPAYYTVQLSDHEIESLNQLTEKNLQSFVKTKKLSAGMHYAGGRDYISFNQGKKQNQICFIEPFMSEEYTEVINMLRDKIYKQDDSTKTKKFAIDFSKIKEEILKQNKIDNYLPKKELPPPAM